MTVEPQNAITVRIVQPMPPKPSKPIPQPKLSMAEEAALVRARFNKKWGRYADYSEHDNDPNEARRVEAQDRRDRITAMILALLAQNGPMTAKAIWAQMREPEEQIRYVMRLMDKAGKIVMGRRTRDGHLWTMVAAE